MDNEALKALFDQQAAGYDQQWAKTAPIRDGLHFLLGAVFSELPEDARILCVGVGTGAEMVYLAQRFPHWRFTAVEPSGAMLAVCRRQAEAHGFASRCEFFEGYLDALPASDPHDAATCFLVSQFMLDSAVRSGFFRSIASRLRPGGLLASSDLSADTASREYETLLRAWFHLMGAAGIPAEGIERMRAAYAKDVAILPPATVASIIEAGGFDKPAPFFQAGLIHGWISRRTKEATR